MPNEIEKVECYVIAETDKAFLLQDKTDPDDRKSYFPKSQVSFSRRNIKTGDAIAEIPIWLLNKKGWNQ